MIGKTESRSSVVGMKKVWSTVDGRVFEGHRTSQQRHQGLCGDEAGGEAGPQVVRAEESGPRSGATLREK